MNIDVNELNRRRMHDANLCIIDIRENEEWESLHIPDVLHIPSNKLLGEIDRIIPEHHQPIYLICHAGVRSSYAAQNLFAKGYQEVYSVDGGILEWAMAGYPINMKE